MEQLTWWKCNGIYPHQTWCDFFNLNLNDPNLVDLYGVYIIWHGPNPPQANQIVYVGQGDIKVRINKHRSDSRILKYQAHVMYVTWAEVAPSNIDGVERYLFDFWQPLVGQRAPDTLPIPASSPWS